MNQPTLVYSDEDHLVRGVPKAPYFRPDWDPVLNLCTSYVFHVCAFRRDRALELDVFGDSAVEWCHDWDTICRFWQAGDGPEHVAEVLYHWRTHEESSTNRPDPERRSLDSQLQLLGRVLAERGLSELFGLEPFPIYRGAPEWWLRRRRIRPEPLCVVSVNRGGPPPYDWGDIAYPVGTLAEIEASLSDLSRAVSEAGEELTVVVDQAVPEGDEWIWEALGLLTLHHDVVVVGGRILSADDTVVAGAGIFGFAGIVGCPDEGSPAHDPGYFGFALKQRCVSAPHPSFFVGRTKFLRETLLNLPPSASLPFLGAWLGAAAAESGVRVAYSPLVRARATRDHRPGQEPGREEEREFMRRYEHLVPDQRWYPRPLARVRGRAYTLG